MLLGLHLDDVPHGGLTALEAVEAVVGHVDVVHWFQAWGSGSGTFRHDWLDLVHASGRLGLISWEPWALTGDEHQPGFSPAAILRGDHDAYIDSWACGFAARNDGPWYLRPMHEMNGTWYPWAQGVAGNTPELYQDAWRYLRHRFDVADAANVAWVWCPLADDVVGPFESYYPGGAFVDVLALDGYNWGASAPGYGGWRGPDDIFSESCKRLAELDSRPVWLAEVGCAPDGGDKAQWITALFDSAGANRLAAIVFFGLDKERDWRIDAVPTVAAAVRRATGS